MRTSLKHKTIDTDIAVAEPPQPALRVLPPPDSARAQAPGGLRKISLGNLNVKPAGETKTQYPVFESDESRELAARIITRQQELDAIEGVLKADKESLRTIVTPFYFERVNGLLKLPSSVSCPSPEGEVLVTFVSKYSLVDETALAPVLGDRINQYFRQTFKITIDGDKIPIASAQTLIDELQILFARHGAHDAIACTEKVKPVDDFHERRHRELTAEQNLAIQSICPCERHVKTKGRK